MKHNRFSKDFIKEYKHLMTSVLTIGRDVMVNILLALFMVGIPLSIVGILYGVILSITTGEYWILGISIVTFLALSIGCAAFRLTTYYKNFIKSHDIIF